MCLGDAAASPNSPKYLEGNSANFALIGFSEVRGYGVLRSSGTKSPLGETSQWVKIAYPTVP